MDKSYLLHTTKYDRHASVFVSTLAKVEYSVNWAVITIQLWWWWWNWEYSGTFSMKYEEKARFSSEMQNISLEIKMITAKLVHTCCNDGIFLALSCIKAFFAVYFSLFYRRTLAFSLILLNQITKRCEWCVCASVVHGKMYVYYNNTKYNSGKSIWKTTRRETWKPRCCLSDLSIRVYERIRIRV